MSDGMCPISRFRHRSFRGAAAALTQSGQTSAADGFGAWKLEEQLPKNRSMFPSRIAASWGAVSSIFGQPQMEEMRLMMRFQIIFFQNRVGTVGAAGGVDQCDERKCYHTICIL